MSAIEGSPPTISTTLPLTEDPWNHTRYSIPKWIVTTRTTPHATIPCIAILLTPTLIATPSCQASSVIRMLGKTIPTAPSTGIPPTGFVPEKLRQITFLGYSIAETLFISPRMFAYVGK